MISERSLGFFILITCPHAILDDLFEGDEIERADDPEQTHQGCLQEQLADRFERRHSRAQRRHDETFQTDGREEFTCL